MTPNVSFIPNTPPSIPFSRDGQENKVSPFFANLCYVMISRKRNYTGWYGKHLVMLCYFKCVSRFIPFCFSSMLLKTCHDDYKNMTITTYFSFLLLLLQPNTVHQSPLTRLIFLFPFFVFILLVTVPCLL